MHDKSPGLIEVESVAVQRSNRDILHGVSMSIAPGPPFAIVGESGSGKTTLLLACLGLLPLARGSIRLNSIPIDELSPRRLAKTVGMVFQDFQLFPHLSVLENLLLAPSLQKRGGGSATAREARSLLADLRVSDLESRYPHELSGGQKQRVAIARSLILKPLILFFDEPSAALDSRTTDELAALLRALNDRTQVVVVSHDRPFIERCCERGVRMNAGHIERRGDLKSILD